MHRVSADFEGFRILGAVVVLADVFSSAIQAADQGNKVVVLRLGYVPAPFKDEGLTSPRVYALRSRSRAAPCEGFGAEKEIPIDI